jgi:hypothetical protein
VYRKWKWSEKHVPAGQNLPHSITVHPSQPLYEDLAQCMSLPPPLTHHPMSFSTYTYLDTSSFYIPVLLGLLGLEEGTMFLHNVQKSQMTHHIPEDMNFQHQVETKILQKLPLNSSMKIQSK